MIEFVSDPPLPLFYYVDTDLQSASQDLEAMKKAMPWDEADKHWRSFVNHIDKAWMRTLRISEESSKRGKFQKIRSEVEHKRKIDPLLKYLAQSRDADNHHSAPIAKMTWEPDGQTMVIYGANADTLEPFEKEGPSGIFRFEPVAFTNRGTQHVPPTMHLGSHIKNARNPYVLGRLALQYYCEKIRIAKEILDEKLTT